LNGQPDSPGRDAASSDPSTLMARRFRGFLPVVVDIESGGFNPATDALLEIAAVLLEIQGDGTLRRGETYRYHVLPFAGANLEPASLQVTGIDPHHPLRPAIPEKDALQRIFREVRRAVVETGCRRAILVGHNSQFDLNFLNAAVARTGIRRNPFHPFSTFDTATLAGVAMGQTVLARALAVAGLEWDSASAHSAAYDAERTADLFCLICNQFLPIYEESMRRVKELGINLAAIEGGPPFPDPAPLERNGDSEG
jgi:ribonuclease T